MFQVSFTMFHFHCRIHLQCSLDTSPKKVSQLFTPWNMWSKPLTCWRCWKTSCRWQTTQIIHMIDGSVNRPLHKIVSTYNTVCLQKSVLIVAIHKSSIELGLRKCELSRISAISSHYGKIGGAGGITQQHLYGEPYIPQLVTLSFTVT